MKFTLSAKVKNLARALVMLATVLFVAFSTGCASTEDQQLSERPWNAPKSWEHGLPTGMMPRY